MLKESKLLPYICSAAQGLLPTDSSAFKKLNIDKKPITWILKDSDLEKQQHYLTEQNKGKDIYNEFIQKAGAHAQELRKNNPDQKLEEHHITPIHAKGGNEKENLVYLTYADHTEAHFIRWVVFQQPGDKIAYHLMSSESEDARRLKASLGGQVGGVVTQKKNKEEKIDRFDSELQRKRGINGAATNRANKTGAWDQKNLIKAREALARKIAKDPDCYAKKQAASLEQGRQTQKALGINIYNKQAQRRKSLLCHGIMINGERLFYDIEQRTHMCDTTFEYYLLYGASARPVKQPPLI